MQRRIALYLCVLSSLFSEVARATPVAKVLHDTDLVVDQRLVRGAPATLHVTVRGATTLLESKPISHAWVTVSLLASGGESFPLASVRTNKAGVASPRFVVPNVEPGGYRLLIVTRSWHGRSRIERAVEVADRTLVHLRTDRPVYKAGQTVRWRVTALNGTDAHPVRDEDVAVVIKDARGTSIWRGTQKTKASGMVAGEVPLGDDLVLGRYQIQATVAGKVSNEAFDVREFRLPPFRVSIEPITSLPIKPARRFRARIVARYPHGEPVAGRVEVNFGGRSENGTLDAFGRFELNTKSSISGRDFRLHAAVTDGAGRTQSAQLAVPMITDELTVAVVPERNHFVPGEKIGVTVLTTDGLGNFVPSVVYLKGGGAFRRVRKKSPGVVRIEVLPEGNNHRLRLDVVAGTLDGRTGGVSTSLHRNYGGGHTIFPQRVVLEAGEKIKIDGAWKAATGDVVATLMRNGVPLASTRARLDKKERLHAELRAPVGVFGLATVRLTEFGWNKKNGQVQNKSEQFTVYLVPARLRVGITGATRYRPGTSAKLEVSVLDDQGQPGRGVGLAASVIDERVLQLGERKKDLVEILRSMNVNNAEAARNAGIAFARLLDKKGALENLARRAIIESLPADVYPPFVKVAAAERYAHELARMQRADTAVRKVLLTQDTALGRRDADGKWDFHAPMANVLLRAGWTPATRKTPWGRHTDWDYAQRLVPRLKFDDVADEIVGQRLDQLKGRLTQLRARRILHRNGSDGLAELLKKKRVAGYLGVDPWGHAIRVRRRKQRNLQGKRFAFVNIESAGPDGRFDSNDDVGVSDVFDEATGLLGHSVGRAGVGSYGFGTRGSGHGGGGAMVRMGSSAATRSPMEAATRKNFDETVLWVAGLPTNDAGQATLDVPLADSITGWKVAVEALSATGALGVATMHIETFLKFYVDATVPRTLTVGDRYVLRAVVANHSKEPATFLVRANVTGSAALDTGAREQSIELPAGATGALGFAIRAQRSGDAEFEFELVDNKAQVIDRVRRKFDAQAPGKLVRKVETGDVKDGQATLAFTVPRQTVGFSGRLRVFRGAIDQAADGLEGMLQEPHGCFEQTSSTTYPNLLVLGLLKNKRQNEALQSRALKLVAKGYQRLISYEVPGGGFSWFGEKPANQVLTAYGLMEFVDMARVYPVDDALVKRTRRWLLGQQGRNGSWQPDKSWLHDWSKVQGKVSTTAYVTWALAESGYRGPELSRALSYLEKERKTLDKNPYLLSLVAATRAVSNKNAGPVLRRLERSARETKDGGLRFSAGDDTLFYATGTGADVQVTALAAMALTESGDEHRARRALDWIWSARSASQGWGTTQGTVLALRAAAANAKPKPAQKGRLIVRLDGKPIGELDLTSDQVPSVSLPDELAAGEHVLTVEGIGVQGVLKSDLRTSWRQTTPPAAEENGLRISLGPALLPSPANEEAKPVDLALVHVGQTVPMQITLGNPGDKVVPMPTLSIPVPPGFRADRVSLDRLVSGHAISKYEDMGSTVHLYMTQLRPGESQRLGYAIIAEAECNVMQRPVQAYAYYDPVTGGSSGVLRLTTTK